MATQAINLLELFPSKHAVDAMRRRMVSWAEVLDVVKLPEVTYTSDGDVMFQRGKLSVVIAKNQVVKTVLRREVQQWDDRDARRR